MRIGTVELDRPLALAPMDDVADPPFRAICKERGADLFFTEFTNCQAVIRNVESSLQRLAIRDEERPIGVQLYGSDEAALEEAARTASGSQPDFVDINAGCWVRKIAMRGDGAGLLRDIGKFESVIKAVMRGTTLPVTVKIRLGWDRHSINVLEVGRMAEQCGVAAVTVHCRTREQAYKGEADWSWLEKLKNTLSVPIIGNGDVFTPEAARRMFETGCDGVMIGRGAINNPWIFEQTKHYLATGEHLPEPTLEERVQLCLDHLKRTVEYKGERRAVMEHRKRYAGYLKGVRNIAKLRASLMGFEEVAPIEEALRRFLAERTSLCLIR